MAIYSEYGPATVPVRETGRCLLLEEERERKTLKVVKCTNREIK